MNKRKQLPHGTIEKIHPCFVKVGNDPSVPEIIQGPQAKVPKSCIESTEYIIRKYKDRGVTYPSASGTSVHLKLKRGSSDVDINASEDEDILNSALGARSYFGDAHKKLNSILDIGQGIALINTKQGKDNNFNMHFLAVIAISDKGVWFSDVSADDDEGKANYAYPMVHIELRYAETLHELRTGLRSGYEKEDFAVGLVEA